MTAILAMGLAVAWQGGYRATFADVWDRWKAADAAWTNGLDRSRRAAALPQLKNAANQLFGARWSEACQALDRAIAELEGHPLSADQAAILRFQPPFVEPGRAARLNVSWAYRPEDLAPLKLRIGNREVQVHPGRSLTLEVRPDRLEPELAKTPELGLPLMARLGNASRAVNLSVVKSGRPRVEKLLASANPNVRSVGQRCRILLEPGASADSSTPLLAYLGFAEAIESGEAALKSLESVPYAFHGRTALRAVFPSTAGDSLTLVVGVSGWGGESAFFDCFGQGLAPQEALKRGWGFIGASTSDSSVADAVDWLTKATGRRIKKLFVLGYSRSAGEAFAAAEMRPPPAAIGLLAPASAAIPQRWTAGPLYFGVGKQDVARILLPVAGIVRELAGRTDVQHDEREGIEHLMLPADAIRPAFLFFDRFSS